MAILLLLKPWSSGTNSPQDLIAFELHDIYCQIYFIRLNFIHFGLVFILFLEFCCKSIQLLTAHHLFHKFNGKIVLVRYFVLVFTEKCSAAHLPGTFQQRN